MISPPTVGPVAADQMANDDDRLHHDDLSGREQPLQLSPERSQGAGLDLDQLTVGRDRVDAE